MMREIPLTKGKVAIIDDEDYPKVSEYKWCYSTGYAVSRRIEGGQKVILLMHRLIMDAPKELVTDHINHDRLDNRRANLRLCTRHQNNCNMPMRSNNKSGYKGVYWRAARNKWQANVRYEGKEYYLGLFENLNEAALAYNAKATELFGEFAHLNVITEEAV